MTCPSCGMENETARKFCIECGASLSPGCPTCGAQNPPEAKFCGECGAQLGAPRAPAARGAPARGAPAAERRLVSVLFADLVGFTTLSESRDAEEVRELLSRYFDTCRRLIELYGGTVEKFIGDAVMAVWGTPTATEDDAERAVRAGLDLVAAVTALGDEVGAPELRARAGVLTGEAAVTIGAEGEGMVAGDLVNTASRIQSAAEPGSVFVGEATRRASEAAVAYSPAGEHELKGKTEPVPLWRALRVTSGRQGALKGAGLEAPFVGRDRELRKIKDLFHASAEERRSYLVSVTGIAGIGKSRLAWEFEKYVDGLADNAYWHRGRCLSYGDGVTYWALADMVRMRCRISEEEDAAAALAKLDATLTEHLLDDDERRFVQPRLVQLLALGEQASGEKQDLFAAWRLFFERLADAFPTVLVFEDVQWADESLLDFVEYLLEWSRSSPLFVMTLGRPELLERRPTWGAGHRNFASLYLEPLPAEAMEELLGGLVPGLPEELRDRILGRAEGVPLYAVETVRMLLDRGLLVADGAVYRPSGEIEALDVPETLQALIAARLDGLDPQERRLLQDGAVLGKTFTSRALAAVSGTPGEALAPVLSSLVRKEVLSLQADPRSPEQGQYGFLQDLVRHVAYETLSRRERRTRHLAAAAFIKEAYADDELAEVLAAHYLDAHAAVPDADDAGDVRRRARETLVRAGERADALGAAREAHRYLAQAAVLADEALERAELLDRAAWHAYHDGDYEAAEAGLTEALTTYEQADETRLAALVSGRLAQLDFTRGLSEQGIARAERALDAISVGEPDEAVAYLASRVGYAYVFTGDHQRAADRLAVALDIGESLGLPEVLARTFAARSMLASRKGHPEEALAFLKHGLTIALDHELWELAGIVLFNLSDESFHRDRYEDALGYLEEALAIVRRRGARAAEWAVLAEMTFPLAMLGRWDEALANAAEIPEDRLSQATTAGLLDSGMIIHLQRGDLGEARRLLALFAYLEEDTGNAQNRMHHMCARASLLRAEGRPQDALALAIEAADLARATFGVSYQTTKQGLVHALEAALALGETERAAELLATLDAIPGGLMPPYLAAQAHRFRARLAGADVAAEAGYAAAEAGFRQLGTVFWLAVVLLEHGEWLLAAGEVGEAEPLLDQAGEIFERLGALPWLERLAATRVAGQQRVPA